MLTTLLITAVVGISIILFLVIVNSELRIDLKDVKCEMSGDIRWEQAERRKAQDDHTRAVRDFEIKNRECEFWRSEAIKLGYPEKA